MVTPEWPEREVDEQFAQIVAGWQQSAPTSGSAELARADATDRSAEATPAGATPPDAIPPGVIPPDPISPGVTPPMLPPTAPAVAPIPTPAAGPGNAPADRDAGGGEPSWRGYRPAELDEHFEPPDPRVPSARDATYWLSVVGLAGGPVLAIWAAVLSGNPDPGGSSCSAS